MPKQNREDLIIQLDTRLNLNNKLLTKYNDDDEVMYKASSINSGLTSYASDRLKDDKEFMIHAIKHHPMSFEYSSDRLKDDKEVVLEAVKQDENALEYASQEIQHLCQDKDPIQTLEKAIAYEKLKTQLKPKADEKSAQKLKI